MKVVPCEIVANSKTAAFKEVVQKAIGDKVRKVYLLSGKEAEGEQLFADLSMQIVKQHDEYYLVVLKSQYDRLEYEKFLALCKNKGVDVGSNMWTTMQLTFPMEFWSMTKQQSIMNKIARQQFQFLATLLSKM